MPAQTGPSPAAADLSHKQLKALAKASRPWWRKKRFWALGVVAVIGISAAVGSGGDATSKKQNGGVSTLSNNGENPPQADVELTKCANGAYGLTDVTAKITNHSSKRSNYIVSVNFLDAAGTKVGEGTAVSNNVEPGQAAIEDVLGTANGDFSKCVVTEVNRFAS